MPAGAVSDIYSLRSIVFRGKSAQIVVQNENGPCPFIAICNVLFLRQYIALPPDAVSVTLSELLNLVTDFLFEKRGLSQNADMQYQLDDVVRHLPSLQVGMDVNVRFRSVDAYEFMPAMVCFDAFNIQMVHGWVLDAADPDFAEVVGNSSYNALTDLLIARNEILDQREKRAAAEQAQKDKADKPPEAGAEDGEADGDKTEEPKQEEELKPEDPKKRIEDDEVIRKASVAEQFLEQTAGQLTYTGLIELNKVIKEGELCVLFRNNHFSTLTKHQNRLFCLLTDVGYADVPEAVWELLAEIDGDMHIVNSQFQAPRSFGRQGNIMNAAAGRQEPPREPAPQPQQLPHQPDVSRQQMEAADAAFAQQLQREEQQLARQREEQRMRLQQQQQQQQQLYAQQPPRQPHHPQAGPRPTTKPAPRRQATPPPAPRRPTGATKKKKKDDGCCTQ